MLCKDKFNVFGPGDHASTYGGNPLACAAGVAVASVFDSDNLVENTLQRGFQLRALAVDIQKRFPNIIKEVRGLGLINGIELAADCDISSADVSKALLAAGVLVVPAGPKVVRFLPPLIVSESDIKEAMTRFETALVDIQRSNQEAQLAKLAKESAASTPPTPAAGSFLSSLSSFFSQLWSPPVSAFK